MGEEPVSSREWHPVPGMADQAAPGTASPQAGAVGPGDDDTLPEVSPAASL